MKKIAFSLSLILFLSALPAFARKPIRTGKVTIRKNVSMEQVATAIKDALRGRGWKVTKKAEGAIDALLHIRSHTAAIAITFDQKEITLAYVSSTNLDYKEKKNGKKLIHRNYNNWIHNLERDIDVNLSLID